MSDETESPTIWEAYRTKIAAGEPLTQDQLQGLLIRAASFVHLVGVIKAYGNQVTKDGETCECPLCTLSRVVCLFFSDHASVISNRVAECVHKERRMPAAIGVDADNLSVVISSVLSLMFDRADSTRTPTCPDKKTIN